MNNCMGCAHYRGLDDVGLPRCAYVGCESKRDFQCATADERDIDAQNEHSSSPEF
jgi:hypothetical protein